MEVTISLHVVKELVCLFRHYKGEGLLVSENCTPKIFLKKIISCPRCPVAVLSKNLLSSDTTKVRGHMLVKTVHPKNKRIICSHYDNSVTLGTKASDKYAQDKLQRMLVVGTSSSRR